MGRLSLREVCASGLLPQLHAWVAVIKLRSMVWCVCMLPCLPCTGAQAGIKADIARAKAKGEAYDPRGHGNAYTHNFLNQKPWHPM